MDLIASVPGHCLPVTFYPYLPTMKITVIPTQYQSETKNDHIVQSLERGHAFFKSKCGYSLPEVIAGKDLCCEMIPEQS